MYNQSVTPFEAAPQNQLARSIHPQQQMVSDPTAQFFAHAFNATTQLAQQSHDTLKHQTQELNRNNVRHVEDWKALVVELQHKIEMKDDTIKRLIKIVTQLETEKNYSNEQLAILVAHIKKEPEFAKNSNNSNGYNNSYNNNSNGYNNNNHNRNNNNNNNNNNRKGYKAKFNANANDYVPQIISNVAPEQQGHFQPLVQTSTVQAFDFQAANSQREAASNEVQNSVAEVMARFENNNSQ